MRRALVVGLAAALLMPGVALGATRVSIGTGPWGGVYFLVGAALANLLNVARNLVPVAFHPGAERYWREKGVLK